MKLTPRYARRRIALAASLLCATAALAQATLPQTTQQQPPPGSLILNTGTQLVIVDVVVQDRHGNPIHGLTQENFRIVEDRTQQSMRHFEEHIAAAPTAAGPSLGPLPAGTFTDYTPMPPGGTLNVLLLDALNTPLADQAYVRYELQQYVKKADPGTRIAIFGLSSRLLMLQGFTSDPSVLKDAVDHKSGPTVSPFAENGTDAFDAAAADANFATFSNTADILEGQLRARYTLDSFNSLAHYLANFPGRKNLIWFSGSFPYDFLADPSLPVGSFGVIPGTEDEFRETVNLLTRAQVAVYPIDARGLQTLPMFHASQSGRGLNGPGFANSISGFNNRQAAEHTTMEFLAEDTGGHAFYNTNGLSQAVTTAIATGSNYYTIAYAPTNHNWNGAYRSIHVELTGNISERNDLKLAYRRGYYADDPFHPVTQHSARHLLSPAAQSAAQIAANAATSGNAYTELAMAHGAPAQQDILFKVRVLPASTTPEETLAPGNTVDPVKPIKGPFQRYDIDFAALTNAVALRIAADGRYKGAVQFKAFLYNADGALLNATGNTVELNLTAANAQNFAKQAMAFHLEISAPVKGDSYLRVAVEDDTAHRIGVVELPLAKVSQLAPPTYPTHAATQPATAPSTSPTASPAQPASTPSSPAAPVSPAPR
jgi:VWFA-related protein